MDGNHFSSGYMPYNQPQQQQSNLASFGNISAQNHPHESPSHATLPPLQSQNGGFSQFGNLSYPQPQAGPQAHTPTTPQHTPATSSMMGNSPNAFSYAPSNMAPPPPHFQPPCAAQQNTMYPASTGMSMPPTTSGASLPTIRPMPPGGVNASMAGLPSLAATAGLGQQSAFMQNEEAPTHVVGSQGRRGILPTAPGRPDPPAHGTSQSTKSMIPQKDADGKYPCPHCNKTYLHAKHLKRHLLRHTGDRPYMCHLCRDTFSRSDILKRHFQKCSIRRGNPTGANHLAHQRRSNNNNNNNHNNHNNNSGNRLSISQQEGPIGLAGLAEVAGPANMIGNSPTLNGDLSTRTSRANSLITPGNMSHRNSIAGLGILGSNAPNHDQGASSAGFQSPMPAYAMQNTTNGGHIPPPYAFSGPQMNGNVYNHNPQQMSFLGQQSSRFDNNHNNHTSNTSNSPHQQTPNGDGSGSGFDWSHVFNQSGQDGFIGSQPANASSQGVNQTKTDPDTKGSFHMQHDLSDESFLGSLYSHPSAFGGEYGDHENGILGFPNWKTDDPLQAKVDELIQFCFPNGAELVQGNPAAEIMKACLNVESVKHFAEHYTSYHGHWPTLHMPTFKLTGAHNALVLAIICIGAVYSSRLHVHQVRQMMEFVKTTVTTNSSIYSRTLNHQIHDLGFHHWDVDELQALLMVQMLFIWHGEPNQRRIARSEFPDLVRIAKAMGLCRAVGSDHYADSMLHHRDNGTAQQIDGSDFNWYGWLEQEKRNRVLYQLFLTDAALAMYFNSEPQFDPLEVRLMLPADDAAWDAKDQQECANALGLNGPEAQGKNSTGTRRPMQPGMREAMRTLLAPDMTFHKNATNVYSKFVLIHAIIVRIIACQKALLLHEGQVQGLNLSISGSGPPTPLSPNDWFEQFGGNGTLSAGDSGHVTPTDAYGSRMQTAAAQKEKRRLHQALEKWKRSWDQDMEIQYPQSQSQLRRFGFSRDGVHFFYLGRSFLQSQDPADWIRPADARFKQGMALLKRIKGFVGRDNETKGQEIGSVGDIDDQYGLDTLTLDMKLLFKPYNSLFDTPVAGVQTGAL